MITTHPFRAPARFGVLLAAFTAATPLSASDAGSLAHEHLVVDTHIDVPYRLAEEWADVTRGTDGGDYDAVRARQGGLDVPFMSIYVPAKLEGEGPEGASYQLAHRLIDSVEAMVARAPEAFTIVATPDQARAARASGRIGLAMGMENGSPVDGDLSRVAEFRARGISYITLAHSLANHISDSSYDEARPNGGLSDFGKALVREMNREGMMVDISHVSDEAFWQALEISDVPLIASHSSARHFTPDWERNMSDEMIKALAARGGVIMINFGSTFLTAEARAWRDRFSEAEEAWLEEKGLEGDAPEARAFERDYRARHPFPYADLDDVLDHFDHVVGLAGVEAVGIGSDYDGVGDSLPVGLKDVSTYPALAAGLRARGYDDATVALMLGGNLMRVWETVVARAEVSAE